MLAVMIRENEQRRRKQNTVTILLLLYSCILFSQQNFDDIYRNTDPAYHSNDPALKRSLHSDFLKTAYQNNDTFKIILGNLYLTNDYIIKTDYTEAMNHLIEADKFANAIKDTLLLGRINHKKGAVYSSLQNYQESIAFYEKALEQSKVAKDSQYIAISMEQLGRRFANIKDYKKSNSFYQQAIPLVEKFCKPSSLSTTLINYGNSLDEQDSVSKAIQVYYKAIAIGEEIQDDYEIIPAKQNLALVFVKIDSLDQALRLYSECVEANTKNSWLDFLIYSYDGLALTYEKMGKIDSAYHYFQKFHYLKDSIIGAEVQNQVAQLEARANLQQKNIEILTQKEATLNARQNLKTAIIIVVIILTIFSLIALYFFLKSKEIKRRLSENRQSLKELTSLLASKNAELRDSKLPTMLKSEVTPPVQSDSSEKPFNYYDMSILTESDWHTFKVFFERSYPKYLQNVRHQFPDISQAEERLFLFIKLQISTLEAANILGVQAETIKKTRTRLRKRLGLEKGENLNAFINNFNKDDKN